MDIKPMRGPTGVQNVVAYGFFVVVLISAGVFNWAPEIRVFNIAPYFVVCWAILEIDRLVYKYNERSMVPLYMSLIPLALLLVVSREAHVLVGLMYFSALMIIQMQSGTTADNYRKHLPMFIALFISVYIACTIAMAAFYTDSTGTSTTAGRALDPPIHLGQEVTVCLSMLLLGVGFLMLEKFIGEYALTLFKHGKEMRSLMVANKQLQMELSKAKENQGKQKKVDIDSPMEKVVQMLKELSADPDMDPDVQASLEAAVRMLTTSDLFSPNLHVEEEDDGGGGESGAVSKFLNGLVGPVNTTTSDDKAEESQGDLGGGVTGVVVQPGHEGLDRLISQIRGEDGLDEDSKMNRIAQVLVKLDTWEFDPFELQQVTNGRALFWTAYALFEKHGLTKRFHLDDAKLRRFLTVIEEGYRKHNPYHNAIHATDVLQTMHYFIAKGGLGEYLTPVEVMATIVACVIHDFQHPGKNNQFLVVTKSPLALRYNDRAVLESFHLAAAFEAMMDPKTNIISSLSEKEQREFRDVTISLVLATDMAQHFDILSRFKTKASNPDDFNLSDNPKDRRLALEVAMKLCDISNPTKPAPQYIRWTKRVMEEFYRQGDAEKDRKLPVSTFYDRFSPQIAKCQIGFMDYIVKPLFEAASVILPHVTEALYHLDDNRSKWKPLVFEIDESYPWDDDPRRKTTTKPVVTVTDAV